ncbi:unnamed protein product, partial [Mesorhabditis belari]|uniref:Uncharacterized protein n=1 Tax=Mesorhabditis belari TaxID=2138241 RepID=A0AAF3F0Q6_9BILA
MFLLGVPTSFAQAVHKLALWTLLAIIFSSIVRFMLLLDINKRVYNHAPGPCRAFREIVNGSAGLEQIDEENLVFITTGLAKYRGIENTKSGLFIYSFPEPSDQAVQHIAREVKIENFSLSHFAPFGVTHFSSKGRLHLYIINRFPTPNCVESFTYNKEKNTATYRKSICDPRFSSLQDIVAVGPDRFFVTNTQFSGRLWAQTVEAAFQASSGSLYLWDGKSVIPSINWMPTPGGLALDKKRSLLFVGSILSETIRVYQLTPSLALKQQTEISLLSSPMGIYVEETSGDIWTALLPIVHTTFYHLTDPAESRIRAPSQVLRVRLQEDGISWIVTEPYANDGATLSASASVLFAKDQLLIGSLFGRLLHCDVINPMIT